MKVILLVFTLVLFSSCFRSSPTAAPAVDEELVIGGAPIRKYGRYQFIEDPRRPWEGRRWGRPFLGHYMQSEIESIKSIELVISPNNSRARNSLEGIEALVNLQELTISSSSMDDVDLSPLNSLLNLNNISLRGMSLSMTALPDFSALASRESIEQLGIIATYLPDLKNLQQLPNLQRAFIRSTTIGSLEGLSGLEKLELLIIDGAWNSRLRIAEILPLPGLRRLTVGHVQTVDITGIDQLASLEELSFIDSLSRRGHILNIQYLSALENLRSLRVPIAADHDISFFENMKNLQTLHIYNGHVYVPPCEYAMAESARLSATGIEPISHRCDDEFYVRPPPLLDLTALCNLSNLTNLFVERFTIKNIAALDNIEGLSGRYGGRININQSVLYDDSEVSVHQLFRCTGI